jgi:2-keto-4-pentenoate hydratase/2-oxohepta-3-ene-1,7-dioic acid hydratase in catechol pathway
MGRAYLGSLLGLLMGSGTLFCQGPAASPPAFKLGNFGDGSREFIGAVFDDSKVVDLTAANEALESEQGFEAVAMPSDMVALIASYESGLSERVRAIVAASVGKTAPYIHDLSALDVKAPIARPGTMLNAAVNYVAHAEETGNVSTLEAAKNAPAPMPGIWERKPDDGRQNPYFFVKPSRAVVGDGDAIRMPPEREMLDWESELAVVIGKTASRVAIEDAKDYIFGYTIENDVSDRNGRPDGRHGSDWFVGKGHDTFAPLGPFIVPKEFIADPQDLDIKFTLNDRVMQDSNTRNMIHNVYELVHYASNVLTLEPGDVLSTGSPSGVGSGRNPPIFMKKGDKSICWIEGIGTLTNPVQ